MTSRVKVWHPCAGPASWCSAQLLQQLHRVGARGKGERRRDRHSQCLASLLDVRGVPVGEREMISVGRVLRLCVEAFGEQRNGLARLPLLEINPREGVTRVWRAAELLLRDEGQAQRVVEPPVLG